MSTTSLCPDEEMQALLALLESDEQAAKERLQTLLAAWPGDPRLPFLEGSLKAADRDYDGGARAMRRALDIAPDYALARFQLGFLQLTSGQAVAAQESWGPLHGLPEESYLRIFVEGLCHLIRDEFAEAVTKLEQGIVRNTELAPLNRDMALIVEELRCRDDAGEGPSGAEPVSAAQMLLKQASLKATKH